MLRPDTFLHCGAGCPFCAGKRGNDLPLREWISKNGKIGFGKTFWKIEDDPSGNVLVEMPNEAWINLSVLTLAPEEAGLMERNASNKPCSRLQCYRMTAKGKAFREQTNEVTKEVTAKVRHLLSLG